MGILTVQASRTALGHNNYNGACITVVGTMNGHGAGGSNSAPSISACSLHQQRLPDEARAAAAWLSLQSDLADAFERFSKDLLVIHARGLNVLTSLDVRRHNDLGGVFGNGGTCAFGAGGGARDALNSLLLLCSEAAAEADRFSCGVRSGVVQPVNIALEPLTQAPDVGDSSCAATPHVATSSGEVQKAARRLQLAEEELTVS